MCAIVDRWTAPQIPGEGGGGFATGIFRCGIFRVSNSCKISHTINFTGRHAKETRAEISQNCLSYHCLCHTLSICRRILWVRSLSLLIRSLVARMSTFRIRCAVSPPCFVFQRLSKGSICAYLLAAGPRHRYMCPRPRPGEGSAWECHRSAVGRGQGGGWLRAFEGPKNTSIVFCASQMFQILRRRRSEARALYREEQGVSESPFCEVLHLWPQGAAPSGIACIVVLGVRMASCVVGCRAVRCCAVLGCGRVCFGGDGAVRLVGG